MILGLVFGDPNVIRTIIVALIEVQLFAEFVRPSQTCLLFLCFYPLMDVLQNLEDIEMAWRNILRCIFTRLLLLFGLFRLILEQ